jgi:hypothetical protein
MVFLSPSWRIRGYHIKIRTRPLPFKSFPIHDSRITLLLDAIYIYSNVYTYVTVTSECAMSDEFILFQLEEG